MTIPIHVRQQFSGLSEPRATTMNRAAQLLDGGVHVADAAVLYHGESEWSGGEYMLFQKPARKLMENGMDVDVVPADLFEEASAADGGSVYHPVRVEESSLWIGEERYACLILPYTQYLAESVIRFVEENAGRGLKTFVMDALPKGDVHGRSLPEAFASHVEVVSLEGIAGKVAGLVEELGGRELVTKMAETDFPGLRSYLVRQPDGLVAMYFNESVSRRYQGQIQVQNPAYDTVTIYDPWQNRAESFALEQADAGDLTPGASKGGRLPLCLEPGEARFYCFESKADAGDRSQAGNGQAGDVEIGNGQAVDIQSGKGRPGKFPVIENSRVLDLDWRVRGISQGTGESRESGLVQGAGETREIQLKAGDFLPNLNGRGYWPSFVGTYVYEGSFFQRKEDQKRYLLLFPEASDSLKLILNGKDLGYLAGFPARVDITQALEDGENQIRVEVTTTLVWERKDGASTHLQVPASGMSQAPVLQEFI